MRRFEMAAEPLLAGEMGISFAAGPGALADVDDARDRRDGGRQLRILANRGLVVPDEDGFRPFSGGFAGWLARMKAAVQAAAEVVPYRDLTA